MRCLAASVALALTSTFGHAAGVNVTVEYRSTQTPRITVLADGKPVEGASVEFIRMPTRDERETAALQTDKTGVAIPLRLAPGRYTVRATHHVYGMSVGQLFLVVEDEKLPEPSEKSALDAGPRTDHFTLSLDTRDENRVRLMLKQAVSAPARTTLTRFSGFVTDTSGARVPGASITVLRKSNDSAEILRTRADKAGEFQSALPAGEYIAVCLAPGFATSVVPFRVVRAGGDERLDIVLQIGPEVLPIT